MVSGGLGFDIINKGIVFDFKSDDPHNAPICISWKMSLVDIVYKRLVIPNNYRDDKKKGTTVYL